MSIYNKVSELEWYLCQKALLKEFLSKNAYEKYLSDLDRFHAEWEGLHEPKIVETENKSALAVYSPINAMLVLSPGARTESASWVCPSEGLLVDADLSRYLVILRRENFWSSEGKRIYFETYEYI